MEDDRLQYGRIKQETHSSSGIPKVCTISWSSTLKENNPRTICFPPIYEGSTKHFQKYKSQRRRMNESIKVIAKYVGIEVEFTTYYIRQSWATIAKFMGIPTEVISEGLGHNSLKTTQIYLRSFTNQVLDEANDLVVC